MIKTVISHGASSHQVELEGSREKALAGKRIGDTVKGDEVGLPGYTLEILGGSDRDGMAMRRDVEGSIRKRLLLNGGAGFNPEERGERVRKTVHGNTIGSEVSQVNLVVRGEGETPLQELIEGSE